jgi:hypothetical protein
MEKKNQTIKMWCLNFDYHINEQGFFSIFIFKKLCDINLASTMIGVDLAWTKVHVATKFLFEKKELKKSLRCGH